MYPVPTICLAAMLLVYEEEKMKILVIMIKVASAYLNLQKSLSFCDYSIDYGPNFKSYLSFLQNAMRGIHKKSKRSCRDAIYKIKDDICLGGDLWWWEERERDS